MSEQLSGLDASFLYLETPTLHMHVAITAVFDPATVPGGYSFGRMRQLILDRMPLAPVFGRRLVEVPLRLGHPQWVDDPDFDIDNHLRRAALPSPGGMYELAEFAADVASRQLPRERPLWEMWVVEGVEGGRIALIAKMHHSTIDGVSGAALLSILFDLEADPAPVEPPARPPDTHIPSPVELLSKALLADLLRPLGVTRMIWRTAEAVLGVRRVRTEAAAGGKGALPLTAPRTSLNVAVSGRRRVAFAAVSLVDVKALKNATGATVNDVVLAVCAGALRRYLAAGGELPEIPLVAVVPVSVVGDVGDAGSNKVSAMFVQLPTHEHDPLERLRLISDGARGAKDEHQAIRPDTLRNWAEHSTPNIFNLGARLYTGMRLADRHRPIANLVISNVPGPDFPLYMAGAEMLAAFPLGPVMDGMGVNITIMSYRGVLYWGLASCARAVPQLWEIAAAVPLALEELLETAGIAPAPFAPPLRLDAAPAEAARESGRHGDHGHGDHGHGDHGHGDHGPAGNGHRQPSAASAHTLEPGGTQSEGPAWD